MSASASTSTSTSTSTSSNSSVSSVFDGPRRSVDVVRPQSILTRTPSNYNASGSSSSSFFSSPSIFAPYLHPHPLINLLRNSDAQRARRPSIPTPLPEEKYSPSPFIATVRGVESTSTSASPATADPLSPSPTHDRPVEEERRENTAWKQLKTTRRNQYFPPHHHDSVSGFHTSPEFVSPGASSSSVPSPPAYLVCCLCKSEFRLSDISSGATSLYVCLCDCEHPLPEAGLAIQTKTGAGLYNTTKCSEFAVCSSCLGAPKDTTGHHHHLSSSGSHHRSISFVSSSPVPTSDDSPVVYPLEIEEALSLHRYHKRQIKFITSNPTSQTSLYSSSSSSSSSSLHSYISLIRCLSTSTWLLSSSSLNERPISESQRTALMLAIEDGVLGEAVSLLLCGANVSLIDRDQLTALHFAAENGQILIVRILLDCRKGGRLEAESGEVEVDARDENGFTPLLSACSEGHNRIVELLLEAGARVNVQNDRFETPLISAVRSAHLPVVQLLLQAGARLDPPFLDPSSPHDEWDKKRLLKSARSTAGETDQLPLALACKTGNFLLLEMLLQNEPRPNVEAIDANGRRAIHYSVINDSNGEQLKKCILMWLNEFPNLVLPPAKQAQLQYEAEVQEQEDSPPFSSIEPPCVDVVMEMIEKGCFTALELILQHRGPEICLNERREYRYRSSEEEEDKSTFTSPLFLAVKLQQLECVDVLLRYHASFTVSDQNRYGEPQYCVTDLVANNLVEHPQILAMLTHPVIYYSSIGDYEAVKYYLRANTGIHETYQHVARSHPPVDTTLLPGAAPTASSAAAAASSSSSSSPSSFSSSIRPFDIESRLTDKSLPLYDMTALHCAAQKGYASIAALLLFHGADLYAATKDPITGSLTTSLHYALEHGSGNPETFAVIAHLIQAAHRHYTETRNRAAMGHFVEAVSCYSEFGPLLWDVMPYAWAHMHESSKAQVTSQQLLNALLKESDMREVEGLLDDPDISNHLKLDLLPLLCQARKLKHFTTLAKHERLMESIASQSHSSPLHVASCSQWMEAVKAILEYKPTPSLANKKDLMDRNTLKAALVAWRGSDFKAASTIADAATAEAATTAAAATATGNKASVEAGSSPSPASAVADSSTLVFSLDARVEQYISQLIAEHEAKTEKREKKQQAKQDVNSSSLSPAPHQQSSSAFSRRSTGSVISTAAAISTDRALSIAEIGALVKRLQQLNKHKKNLVDISIVAALGQDPAFIARGGTAVGVTADGVSVPTSQPIRFLQHHLDAELPLCPSCNQEPVYSYCVHCGRYTCEVCDAGDHKQNPLHFRVKVPELIQRYKVRKLVLTQELHRIEKDLLSQRSCQYYILSLLLSAEARFNDADLLEACNLSQLDLLNFRTIPIGAEVVELSTNKAEWKERTLTLTPGRSLLHLAAKHQDADTIDRICHMALSRHVLPYHRQPYRYFKLLIKQTRTKDSPVHLSLFKLYHHDQQLHITQVYHIKPHAHPHVQEEASAGRLLLTSSLVSSSEASSVPAPASPSNPHFLVDPSLHTTWHDKDMHKYDQSVLIFELAAPCVVTSYELCTPLTGSTDSDPIRWLLSGGNSSHAAPHDEESSKSHSTLKSIDWVILDKQIHQPKEVTTQRGVSILGRIPLKGNYRSLLTSVLAQPSAHHPHAAQAAAQAAAAASPDQDAALVKYQRPQYQYYRLSFLQIREWKSICQLSAVYFYRHNRRYRPERVFNPRGHNPRNEEADNLKRPMGMSTKWSDHLCGHNGGSALIFDMGEDVGVTHYELVTAYDHDERDPAEYEVYAYNPPASTSTSSSSTVSSASTASSPSAPTSFDFDPTLIPDSDWVLIDVHQHSKPELKRRVSLGKIEIDFRDTVDASPAAIERASERVKPIKYRYYKLFVVRTWGHSGAVQVSGINFYAPEGIARPRHVSNPGGTGDLHVDEYGEAVGSGSSSSSSSHQSYYPVSNLIDNLGNTKWRDSNMGKRGRSELLFDFDRALHVEAYAICTAADSPENDPISWRLDASLDQEVWTTVHEHEEPNQANDTLNLLRISRQKSIEERKQNAADPDLSSSISTGPHNHLRHAWQRILARRALTAARVEAHRQQTAVVSVQTQAEADEQQRWIESKEAEVQSIVHMPLARNKWTHRIQINQAVGKQKDKSVEEEEDEYDWTELQPKDYLIATADGATGELMILNHKIEENGMMSHREEDEWNASYEVDEEFVKLMDFSHPQLLSSLAKLFELDNSGMSPLDYATQPAVYHVLLKWMNRLGLVPTQSCDCIIVFKTPELRSTNFLLNYVCGVVDSIVACGERIINAVDIFNLGEDHAPEQPAVLKQKIEACGLIVWSPGNVSGNELLLIFAPYFRLIQEAASAALKDDGQYIQQRRIFSEYNKEIEWRTKYEAFRSSQRQALVMRILTGVGVKLGEKEEKKEEAEVDEGGEEKETDFLDVFKQTGMGMIGRLKSFHHTLADENKIREEEDGTKGSHLEIRVDNMQSMGRLAAHAMGRFTGGLTTAFADIQKGANRISQQMTKQAIALQHQAKTLSQQANKMFKIPKRPVVRAALIDNNLDVLQLAAKKKIEGVALLHSPEDRKRLLEKWRKKWGRLEPFSLSFIRFSLTEGLGDFLLCIEELRDYCGDRVAFYFTFVAYSIVWQMLLLVSGIALTIVQIVYGVDNPALPWNALLTIAWSTFYCDFWNRKSSEMACRWGTLDLNVTEEVRAEYEGELFEIQKTVYAEEMKKREQFKNNKEAIINSYKNESKPDPLDRFRSVPFRLVKKKTKGVFSHKEKKRWYVCLQRENRVTFEIEDYYPEWKKNVKYALSAGFVVLSIGLMVVINLGILYLLSVESSSFFRGVIGVINGIAIEVLQLSYNWVSELILAWQNHKTYDQYTNSKILLNFSFAFFNSYFSLFYIAVSSPGQASNLAIQLVTVVLTGAATDVALETLLPLIYYKYRLRLEKAAEESAEMAEANKVAGEWEEKTEETTEQANSDTSDSAVAAAAAVSASSSSFVSHPVAVDRIMTSATIHKLYPTNQPGNRVLPLRLHTSRQSKHNQRAAKISAAAARGVVEAGETTETTESLHLTTDNPNPPEPYQSGPAPRNSNAAEGERPKEDALPPLPPHSHVFNTALLEVNRPPKAELLDDYLSVVISMGYVMCFSAILPAAPLLLIAALIVECHSDLYKYLHINQRAIQERAANIGVWSPVLQVLSFGSIITNGVVIFYSSDQWKAYVSSTTTRTDCILAFVLLLVLAKICIMALVPDTASWVSLSILRKQFAAEQASRVAVTMKPAEGEDNHIDVVREYRTRMKMMQEKAEMEADKKRERREKKSLGLWNRWSRKKNQVVPSVDESAGVRGAFLDSSPTLVQPGSDDSESKHAPIMRINLHQHSN